MLSFGGKIKVEKNKKRSVNFKPYLTLKNVNFTLNLT